MPSKTQKAPKTPKKNQVMPTEGVHMAELKRPNSATRSRKKSNNSKATIPKALREQVWMKYVGNAFDAKCHIRWCRNCITAFDFHVGHNIPEAKGGTLALENLRPLCARCNLSMGSQYTIDEWQRLGSTETVEIVGKKTWWCC
jgi:5-methylcytosine-specific restriction endonuclease McrA